MSDAYDELLSLAMDAAEEVGHHDEGDYRARHILMDFVAQRPGLIVRLIENEDDRMSVLAEDLRKTKAERDKLLPFVLVRCPKCREFMMPDEGNDALLRNNNLVRAASQQRRRIAKLETAATEYLDFAFGNQLPNDEPKSEMLRLANRLYHTAWQNEDPGTEYGAGGSIDPAPDAVPPRPLVNGVEGLGDVEGLDAPYLPESEAPHD